MSRFSFSKNKLWVITLVVFVVLITLLDSNSVLDKIQLNRDLVQLRAQKSYYLERIKEDSTLMQQLKDDEFLERYAREKYFMRKKGEVIYIVQD